jgi:hypothetical protein
VGKEYVPLPAGLRLRSVERKQVPIIQEILLNLSVAEVLRRAGIKEDSMRRPKMEAIIEELLEGAANDGLLEPIIAYEIYPIIEINEHKTRLQGDCVLEGSLISSAFSRASELAIVVCTIGLKLERAVTKHFERKELLKGLLLDGIGSATMDSLCQHICQLMSNLASEQDYEASSPLNPGMPGFPMSEQWNLFHLVPAREINVSLTSSGMMIPRKSVSMVIGIGHDMKTWTQAEKCAKCTLTKTCAYKHNGGSETSKKGKR